MRRITILIGAMAALMLVPAASAFAEEPNVKVVLGGTGYGEIVSQPIENFGTEPPIECSNIPGEESSACEGTPEGEEAEEGYFTPHLEQHAAPGSEFAGWTIVKGESSPSCPVGVEERCWLYNEEEFENDEWELIAEFGAEASVGPLLTTIIEEGQGTVVSNPAGIECTGFAPHSCSTPSIEEGTVTLTASPASGYAFKSWKGCDKKSGEFGVNGRQCTINLNEEKSVSAKFIKVYGLKLKNGGDGKISSKPGGALCLPNCSETIASFQEGKTVEVLPKPNKHFHLVSWGGDCSGTGTCSVTMNGDRTVSATFAEDQKFDLALSKEGGGTALIKTKGPGTVCSYTCGSSVASFYTGETVLVSWKLGKGTSSLTWTSGAGTCTGTHEGAEGSCEVTMSSGKLLRAELE